MISPNQVSRVAGLFGGMGATPDPAVPADPRQQNAMQAAGVTNPLLQQFGRSVAGLFGKADQMASPMQQMNRAIQSVKDPSSYEGKLKIAQAVMQIDPMQGTQLLQAAEKERAAALQAQQRRSSLIKQATNLGLENTAELLKNGGDVTKAGEQIREEEKRQLLNRSGRAGRISLATAAGFDTDVVSAIKSGNYDRMSDDQFNDMISGREADLSVYAGPDGVPKPYKVNDFGQVFNDQTETWQTPAEANLIAAPQMTKEIKEADSITAALTDGLTNKFLEVNATAEDASKNLELLDISQGIFDEGIISGFGGKFQEDLYNLLDRVGVLPEGAQDKLSATQSFFRTRARGVLTIISALGAGSGISDADREYAAGIEAGDISLNGDAIQRLMDISRRASLRAIDKNNTILEQLNKASGGRTNPNTIEAFMISYKPSVQSSASPQAPQLSPAALRYLRTQ